MIWRYCIIFELDPQHADLGEQISDWLAARDVPYSIESNFRHDARYDPRVHLRVLLPPGHGVDAVYLSFWPGCRGIERV